MAKKIKSGVKIGLRGDPEFSFTRAGHGKPFQTIIDAYEKETGCKVKAIEIDLNYGLYFIL
jgi:hypothetical protein